MPKKWATVEEKRQYQRDLYHRNEELRRRTIAKVRQYKQEHYQGTCIVCGGTTQGSAPSNIPRYCSKNPECRSAAHRVNRNGARKKDTTQISLMDVFTSPETWAP